MFWTVTVAYHICSRYSHFSFSQREDESFFIFLAHLSSPCYSILPQPQRPQPVSSLETKREVITIPYWLLGKVSSLYIHILGLTAICLPGSCYSPLPNATSAPFLNPQLTSNSSGPLNNKRPSFFWEGNALKLKHLEV